MPSKDPLKNKKTFCSL